MVFFWHLLNDNCLDSSVLTNFRPISKLTIIAKILEIIMSMHKLINVLISFLQ